MKRILTSLTLIFVFILQGQTQILNNYCESQSACNARPICGATIVTANSFTTTAPYNVNPIGTCASLSGTFAYTPNWVYYRIKCNTTGTFNFRLVSNDSATVNSDLDWAMWDITTTGCGTLGTPNTVECNAAGNGPTGISGVPTANFEPSIIINAGSSYIIGISNPTGANSGGFTMSFGGTTANILDNRKPFMANLMPFDPCAAVATLKIKLSEPVRCSQVGVGTDFTISPAPPAFVVTPGATCPGCTNITATPPNYGNATDTATLTFATAIPPGTYTITASANAFFDLCGNSDSTQKTIVFTVPIPFKDSVRSGFDCLALKYIDTVYGVSGFSPYEYKAVGGGLPLAAATFTAPTASYQIYVVSGGTPVTYTVRDAAMCLQDTTLNRPSVLALGAPNLSLSASPLCHNQFALDSISVFAQSGGIGPYTFSLAPGLPTVTWNFTPPAKWKNIVFPGLGTIFTVTVTDANGCTKTGLKNLVNPSVVALALPAPTNPKCFGDSSGKICFTQATGGTPFYTYTITPSYPNTTFTTLPGNCFNNLPAGTYTVTATDNNGCTATATKILSQPSVISINTSAATILNPTCPSNCNGTYQPIATGGTGSKKFYKYPFVGPGPLTYTDSVVSSIAPNNKFLGLCPGTYTILAVDALGCTATATVTLAWPASPNLNLVTVNPVPCFGGNGSIAVNVSPGLGNQFPPTAYTTVNYTIFPTPGALGISTAAPGGSNATFNNVPANTYTIIVTNNNQCADTLNVTMTEPSAPVTYSSVVVDSVLCFGTSTGIITAQATGGTPGVNTYQYSIKIGAAPFTAFSAPSLAPHVYSGLAAGTYTIRVRDHNLCIKDSIVTIYQPTKLNLLLDDVDATCFGTLNGEICVVDTGGTADYQYKLGIAGAYSAPQTVGFVYCFSNLAAGNYSVFTVDAKGCLDTLAVNIASIPLPIVSFTATPNDTVCDGTAITLCGTGADAYVWTGGINDCSAFVPALGSSQYIVTGTNNTTTCSNTDTVDVLVNPIPVATPVADQIVCNGVLTTAVNFTSSVGGTNFAWTHNAPGCGIAASGVGNLPSFTAINTSTIPLVVTFTVTPTGPNTTNCIGADITFTITINPSASIALTSSIGTDAQVVCIGDLLLDIDYTISGGGTGATVAGLPTGVTGLYNFPIMTLSGTPTGPAGTYTYTVTTTGTCAQTSTTGTIIINPDATVALSSPIGTDAQTPCINTTITAITYTVGGTGNNGFVTGLPPGVNGTYTAGVITITGSPTAAGLYSYTVNAIGTCDSAFITGTINVIPLQDPSFTYPSATYCQTGTDPLPLITGAAGGTFSCPDPLLLINSSTGLINLDSSALNTYTIKYVTSGQCPDSATFTLTITLAPTAGFSYIPVSYCQNGIDPFPTFAGGASGGLFSALPSTLIIDVTTGEIDLSNSPAGTYTVKNFIVAAGGCDSAVATATVIIDSTTILTDPSDQIVCNNTLTAPVNFVSTLPSTYNWSHNAPGCGIASPGVGNIPAFTAINTGTTPIVVTFTVTPTGPAANFCTGLDQTFTITINPTPVLTDLPDQVLCAGDFTADAIFVSNVAGTVFDWTNSNNTIGLPFFFGTGDILSFQGLNVSNVPNIGIITITPSANGCPGADQTFSYTINPIPAITDPADQIVCNNTSTAAVNFVSSVGGTNFTWSHDNTIACGILPSGSGNIPVFTATNTGTTPLVVTFTVNAIGPNPTNCPALNQSFTITINPTPTVDPNVDQTVCAGAFTNTVLFTGNVAGTVYTWTNSNPSIGLIAGNTGDIISFAGTNITNIPQTGIIIVTTLANGCPGTTDTFTITVDPIPAVNFIADQTICDNENSTVINITSNVIGTSFVWSYTASSNIGLTPTFGNGNTIPVFTAVNTGTTPIVATFTVTPTGPANGNCDGVDSIFTITVLPRQNPSFSYSPSTFCQTGTDPLPIFGAGATLGGTFTATPAGLLIDPSTGLINLDSSALNTYSINYVTPGPCPDSATFNVTITLAPIADFTYANANYCQQALINPLPVFIAPASAGIFSATPAGLYFVNVNTGEINLATSNAGTYTVSNIIAAAGGCAADTGTFIVTIDSATVLTDPNDLDVCNNSPTGAIVFASTLAGTGYTWTNNTTSIGLAASSGGTVLSIPSFNATNTGTTPVIATITVTPIGPNGCTGLQHSFTITVNPTPVVTDPADQVWCPGYGTNAVNFVSNVVGTTFSWTNSLSSIGIGVGPTPGNLPSFITTNTGSTPLVGIFTVTPSGPLPTSCPGLPVNFSITVNPDATVVLTSAAGTASQIVCEGTTITPIVYAIGGTGNNAYVIGMPAGITGNYFGGAFTITGSSTAFGNYIYSVIATGSCGNDTLSGSLEITPLQDPTFTYPLPTNCQFGTTSPNLVVTTGGVFSATAVSPPGALVINGVTGVIDLAASDTGLYTIKYVTPGPLCKDSTTLNIFVTSAPSAQFTYASANYCQSAANPSPIYGPNASAGTFSAIPAGLQFTPGIPVGRIDLINSLPNTYQVINTIAPSGACPGVADTFSVTITSKPSLAFVSSTPAGCNPNCNGTFTTSTSGGSLGYLYSILPASASINALGVASALCVGTIYTITVTDAIGCTGTMTATVTQSIAPVLNITAQTNTSAVGTPDGTVTTSITPLTGTGPFTYTVSPSGSINAAGYATILFGDTACITYTIIVTDSVGCKDTVNPCIFAPGLLNCSQTHTNVLCFGDSNGTFKDTVFGGTAPYSFSLVGPVTVFTQVTPTSISGSGLPAGNYVVTVTDSNGIICTNPFTITTPTQLIFTAPTISTPSCSPVCNGTLSITANGGTGTKTYAIQSPVGMTCTALPGATAGSFTGLGVGIYTIIVTDGNFCTASTTVQINASPLPTIALSHTNPLCNNNCNGTITSIGGAGTSPYTYSIISPTGTLCVPTQSSPSSGIFTTLGSGTYTVTILDNKGCTASDTETLVNPPVLVLNPPSSTSPLCFGDNNATITLVGVGGTGVLTYTVNLLPPNTTGVFTGLSSGTYTVGVTDATGCSITGTVQINDPAALSWTTANVVNITCAGSINGIINTVATGGTGTKEYSKDGAIFVPSGSFTGLSAGTYTITAKDANGCTLTTTLTIIEPPVLALGAPIIVDVTCNGANNGSITIAASGGTPGYGYSIAPNSGTQTTPGVFINLPNGTYAITVTDTVGCSKVATGIVVNQPAPLVFTLVNHQDVACFGDATGTITANTQGGTPLVSYSLLPNLGVQSPVGFFSGLLAGTYVVTATDTKGCTTSTNVTITQGPQIVISNTTTVEPICNGDANGIISFTVSGGTGQLKYQLNGGPLQIDTVFKNLLAGNYLLTVVDALGCTTTQVIILLEPDPVGALVNLIGANCIDSKDGKAIIVGTGGRGGYKYYLTPGLHINKSGIFVGLEKGTYVLRVVDTSGCEYKTQITIDPPANPLSTTITKQDLACNGVGNEGTATANVAGGTPPYTYFWSTDPPQITPKASTLYFGYYDVTITDANGCTIKDTTYIEEGPCCEVAFIPNAFSPNGDQTNDEFRVLTTAGVELIQLEIYNRWGKRVFATIDYRRGWDGTIDGKEGGVDTYFYIFRYKCTRDNLTYTKKGDILLIR